MSEKRGNRWVHGCAIKGRESAEYRTWKGIVQRCTDANAPIYRYYGGRGVTICDRWRSFEAFLADVGFKPNPTVSLDRIDNDRGYEPGNVRWASKRDQARNRRSNHILTAHGESLPLVEWAARLGVSHASILSRIARGWTVEAALLTPPRADKRRREKGLA